MSLDIIYMTYCPENDSESGTGRRLEIEITPEMIEAGAKEVTFDSELLRTEVAEEVLRAALRAGGYQPV